MFGPFPHQYPYTNFHDLNLDWILHVVKNVDETLKNFVSLNTVKYADPIQWNIATQYGVNTVVVDPDSGTAYISVQPVPSGVPIDNTEYWTPVFDMSKIVPDTDLQQRMQMR